MREQKKADTGEVGAFLAAVDDPVRRADSEALVALMREVSGQPPVLWGSMVGFGRYHYRYASGREGDAFLVGFAPDKAEFSIYLMGCEEAETARRDELLGRLGKHRMGKACLYVRRLADVDMTVLRELAEMSVRRLRAMYPAD